MFVCGIGVLVMFVCSLDARVTFVCSSSGVPLQLRNCLLLSQEHPLEAAQPRLIEEGAPAALPHAYLPTILTATISTPM